MYLIVELTSIALLFVQSIAGVSESDLNSTAGDVIKESGDFPRGWKIVSEPSDEAQLQVKNDGQDTWTTEWTSRSLGGGKSLGAVPDFLQELRNEYHGPDFDYFASFDNSNEDADESDYHYKTPFDSHDFLSHHQHPDAVQWSNKQEWWIPHNRVLELQKNEADLDTVRKKVAGYRRRKGESTSQGLAYPLSFQPKTRKTSHNKKAQSKQLDKRITKLMNMLERKSRIRTQRPRSPKPTTLLKKQNAVKSRSKNKKGQARGSKNTKQTKPTSPRKLQSKTKKRKPSFFRKLRNKTKKTKKPSLSRKRQNKPHKKKPPLSRVSTKAKSPKSPKGNLNETRAEVQSSITPGKASVPLEKIVKKLVSGVQNILQMKKGNSQPVKGSWALSYKVNNTKKGGQHKNVTFLEANDMLLKFNNSNENQEDWSLIFHRGRSDVGNGQKYQNAITKPGFSISQKLREINGAKLKRNSLSQKGKKFHTKGKLMPTENGWSVFKRRPPYQKKKKIKSHRTGSKAKKAKTNKSEKTMLPTDDGWSVFRLNNTLGPSVKSKNSNHMLRTNGGWSVHRPGEVFGSSMKKNQIKPHPRASKRKHQAHNGWTVLKPGNSAQNEGRLISSKGGWFHSGENSRKDNMEILKKTYVKNFEPAKVVTASVVPQSTRKSDVNNKLLSDSNEDNGNTSMLEDEKDEVDREYEKGHAVDITTTNINGDSNVTSLPETKPSNSPTYKDEEKVVKAMDTIRKAGLDSPKNTRRILRPKGGGKHQEADLVSARGSDMVKTVDEDEEAKKDENKTTSEANLQASLHESLQSAMSGIVKVFNNHVGEGHSVMAVKGSLKPHVNVTVSDKQQRAIPMKDLTMSNIMWTPWSQWGACSVSCGRGWITRRRFCLTVTKKCDGRAIEMKFCHMKPCPEEIVKATEEVGALLSPQGEWAPWSPCSVTCGEGWAVRRKICYGRHLDRCAGPMVDIMRCRKHRRCISPLRKKLLHVRVKPVGEQVTWSAWSACSVTCGRGWKIRTRECNITNLNKCTTGRFDIKKCHKKSCRRMKGRKLKHHLHHYRHRHHDKSNIGFREYRESGKEKTGDRPWEVKADGTMSRGRIGNPKHEKKSNLVGKTRKDNKLIDKMDSSSKPKGGSRSKGPGQVTPTERGPWTVSRKGQKLSQQKFAKPSSKIMSRINDILATDRLIKNQQKANKEKTERNLAGKVTKGKTPGKLKSASERKPVGNPKAPTRRKPVGKLKAQTRRKPVGKLKAQTRRKPVGKLKTPTQRKPVGKLKAQTRRKPVGKLKTPTQRKPVAKSKTPIQRKPVRKLKAQTRRKPVGKSKTPIQRRPVGKLKAQTRRKPVGKSKTPIQKRPVGKLKAQTRRKPVGKSKTPIQRKPVGKLKAPNQRQHGKPKLQLPSRKQPGGKPKPRKQLFKSQRQKQPNKRKPWIIPRKDVPARQQVAYAPKTKTWTHHQYGSKGRNPRLKKLHEMAKRINNKKAAVTPSKAWSKWSSWSDCSKTCGTGIQSKIRTCLIKRHRGKLASSRGCQGDSFETQVCATDPCDPYDNGGIMVPEGFQVKLMCPYKPSSKVAKIHWITPHGKSINEDTLDMRYLVKGSVLYIKHSRKDDVGVYHCMVAARGGQILETLAAQLVVQTCKDNFCQNGGQCFELPATKDHPFDRAICKCAEGFSGQFCTHSLKNGTISSGSNRKIPIFVKDRKLLVVFVVLMFAMVVALCYLLLCMCRMISKTQQEKHSEKTTTPSPSPRPPDEKPDKKKKKKQVYPTSKSEEHHVQMEPVYEEIDSVTPRSEDDRNTDDQRKVPEPSRKRKGKKSALGEAVEIFEEGRSAMKDICFPSDTKRGPPSKAEIEASERAQSRQSSPGHTRRGLAEGASKRSLPSTPVTDRAVDNDYQGPVPNVSSGYLHPTNRNPQVSNSLATDNNYVKPAQDPMEFNTKAERGIHEQQIYEYPGYAVQSDQKLFANQDTSPETKESPLYSQPAPRSPHPMYENLPPHAEKSPEKSFQKPDSSPMYTSTPIASPSDSLQPVRQVSMGFQTSPATEQSPSDNQGSVKKHHSAGSLSEGLTGLEAVQRPSSGMYGRQYFPPLQSPGNQTSPLNRNGRVSPPIRSRIADLEAAMGYGGLEYPPSNAPRPLEGNISNQSFGDSFTGLKEPSQTYEYRSHESSYPRLLKDASTQSLGDSFTGLKESLHQPPSTATQRGGVTLNESNQSLGDSFTGLRRQFSPQNNSTRGVSFSNESFSDSLPRRKTSNRNSNAQAREENDLHLQTRKNTPPPTPPKPTIKWASSPPNREMPSMPVERFASNIVRKTMEDSIAKNIVNRTVQDSLRRAIEVQAMKKAVNDGTKRSPRSSIENVTHQRDTSATVPLDADEEFISYRTHDDSPPEDNNVDDNTGEETPRSDEGNYSQNETNELISSGQDNEPAESDQESNAPVIVTHSDEETTEEVEENVLDRASHTNLEDTRPDDKASTGSIESEDVSDVVNEVIEVTSNEVLDDMKNQALADLDVGATATSSLDAIKFSGEPPGASSDDEVNV